MILRSITTMFYFTAWKPWTFRFQLVNTRFTDNGALIPVIKMFRFISKNQIELYTWSCCTPMQHRIQFLIFYCSFYIQELFYGLEAVNLRFVFIQNEPKITHWYYFVLVFVNLREKSSRLKLQIGLLLISRLQLFNGQNMFHFLKEINYSFLAIL